MLSLSSKQNENQEPMTETTEFGRPPAKGLFFWLVIASICLIGFTASLEGSITAIAIPKISAELDSGDKYVYIGNSFLLASTVIQPAFAQLCDIIGRRYPMIFTIALFALGSGIAGGARSTKTLIAGWTVQGLSAGSIMLMVELIVCDLVPLKERGAYLGIVLSVSALRAIVGPVVRGALAEKNWRWCFYLNLPICAVVLPVMVFFLQICHHKITWRQIVERIDWIGIVLFIGSICAIILGLVFVESHYSARS